MSEEKLSEATVAYDRQLGLAVYHLLVAGKSYGDIAEIDGMPGIDTMLEWFDHEPDFQHLVSLACADKAQALANEVKAIADSVDPANPAAVAKARLQCDVRMWLAGRHWPSKYGSCL